MKNMSLLLRSIVSIDRRKENNMLNSIDNIAFAATVGFMSGAIYGVEYYFGSLTTGVIGFFVGGLAGYTLDKLLPLK